MKVLEFLKEKKGWNVLLEGLTNIVNKEESASSLRGA